MDQITDTRRSQDADFKYKNKLFSVAGLMERFSHRESFKYKLSQLTLSQWFYVVASLLFVVLFDGDYENDGLVWVGVIAGIGLFRELWHLFQRVWDKMLGKGIILILYAATANFALAISALKINAIAGIEPTPFVFTLGFTTLLMLPFWLTITTALFFSIALVALNFWLLISILLRLVRIKIQVHWEDRSFVFITMIMRLVLIPAVIMTLGTIIMPYAKQIETFDGPVNFLSVQDLTDEQVQQLRESSEEKAEAMLEQFKLKNATTEDAEQNSGAKKVRHLDRIVATFIYWFETYPNSGCVKAENQRSLVIDENSILVVERDKSELGFKFAVLPCVPKYQDVQIPAVQAPETQTPDIQTQQSIEEPIEKTIEKTQEQ
ncbi:hypothetical protein [Aliiglaciecola sp. M165]|uniref:hypothetical protein n=1 Tax=Aliiglaciecola sp. M165 TaxID=2593649 RepID=UPI00163DAEF4|nr:hypothetical protein [Aliiglaciecola sp. M165]